MMIRLPFGFVVWLDRWDGTPKPIENKTIIALIEAYCLETGMAVSTFGRKVVNDGKLITRLRDGKPISIDTYNRILAFISEDAA